MSPRAKTFLTGILLTASGLLLGKYFFQALQLGEGMITDFTVYYKIPQIVFSQSRIPYNNFAPIHPFFYPPASVLFLRPLSFLPYNLSKLIWTALLTATFLGSIYLIKKILKLSWLATSFFLLLGTLMYPVVFSITDGQINPLLLFLLVSSYYAFTKEKDILAGFLLAIATIFKISPALLLLYFLWRRQYKVFFSGVFFILLFSGLAELVLPKEGVGLINWYYLRHVVDDVSKQGGPFYRDQSLLSFLLRWRPLEWWFDASIKPSFVGGLITTAQRFYSVLGFGVVGLIILAVGWMGRRPLTDRSGSGVLVDYSILITLGLVGTGLTWYHQYVLLLFPWIVALVLLNRGNPFKRVTPILALSIAFFFWAYNLETQFRQFDLVQLLSQEAPMLIPIMFYGAVVLIVSLFYVRLSTSKKAIDI